MRGGAIKGTGASTSPHKYTKALLYMEKGSIKALLRLDIGVATCEVIRALETNY